MLALRPVSQAGECFHLFSPLKRQISTGEGSVSILGPFSCAFSLLILVKFPELGKMKLIFSCDAGKRIKDMNPETHAVLFRCMNEVCCLSQVSEGPLLPDILRTFQKFFSGGGARHL